MPRVLADAAALVAGGYRRIFINRKEARHERQMTFIIPVLELSLVRLVENTAASEQVPTGMNVGFYQDRIVPYLVHMSMRQESLIAYRQRAASAAVGRVLEIGIGSGLNLPHYGDQAQYIIGLEPSAKLLSMAAQADRRRSLSVELVKGSAETIPIDDNTVDTVLTTWTLCTIPDVNHALSEMRRVLKPTGQLLFVEHGRSHDDNVQRWQNRLNPIWKRIAGGCHLNRAITELIKDAGFRIERLDTGYMQGPRPMTFMYEGAARRS